MKYTEFNLSEKRIELIKEFIGHTDEEHPENCGCYICHHQEEFKKAFTDLFDKIQKQDKEFIRLLKEIKFLTYEQLEQIDKLAGEKLI